MKLLNPSDPLLALRAQQRPEFHDVRILCDDGGSTTASKLLLAAASPVMKAALLDSEGDDHITVVGVKANEVQVGLVGAERLLTQSC